MTPFDRMRIWLAEVWRRAMQALAWPAYMAGYRDGYGQGHGEGWLVGSGNADGEPGLDDPYEELTDGDVAARDFDLDDEIPF